jgi:hypothetical protein
MQGLAPNSPSVPAFGTANPLPVPSARQLPALYAAPERPAALGSFFDGSGKNDGSASMPQPREWLDGMLKQARSASYSKTPATWVSLQALESILWSRSYMPSETFDGWALQRAKRLAAIDRRVARELERVITAELDAGDWADAREALDELATRHQEWARAHDEMLAPLRARLPGDNHKAEPHPPLSEPAQLAQLVDKHLLNGEFRQAEYIVTTLEKKHPAWAAANAEQLASWKRSLLEATYRAFEERKTGYSPMELRRLREYTKALAEGSNRGFGFKQPMKQDPNSRMCTIMSLCEAIEASMGFADPSMNLDKFTALVRQLLKDEGLGTETGLSTHRVKNLMKHLGLPMRVLEMQERMKRPFEEAELTRLFRPDQVVIAVFIIAQQYPDEKGLQREEHKGFLRDAYFSETEKRWVYLMADPLIGRISFYTWPEIKPFLHKLFVIKMDKKLSTPQ